MQRETRRQWQAGQVRGENVVPQAPHSQFGLEALVRSDPQATQRAVPETGDQLSGVMALLTRFALCAGRNGTGARTCRHEGETGKLPAVQHM
ncbi:hypothetical protein ACFWRV_20090 [Streptomyces sp. NPDC058576]|uniref:hypothetical protein n=1 Tax=Streptomyces sp. NPDC058576 TaxID=3346547 RepID=UPI0036699447